MARENKREKIKIFPLVCGKTFKSEETFLGELTKKGAKRVETSADSDVTIVFCPIVSRFQTDIEAALSTASDKGCKKVILVAMHHTFDKHYTLPDDRHLDNRSVVLLVQSLFYEKKGLLKCPQNKKAVKSVHEELGLSTSGSFCSCCV